MIGLKGSFILSINDTPEIRAIFVDFMLDEVRLSYSAARESTAEKAKELIISNREVVPGLI